MVDLQDNKRIYIGRAGENEVETVQFDIHPWIEEFGEGNVILLIQRPQDLAPYPVEVSVEDGIVTWAVTSADTQYIGMGAIQLRYTVDEQVKKSAVWSVYVERSLGTETEPPEPWQSWVDKVISAKDDAEEAAERAEELVDTVERATPEEISAIIEAF